MIENILLISGLALTAGGAITLKNTKKESKEWVWVGYGKDPFKKDRRINTR